MTRHPAFSFRRVLAALFWLALLAPASPVLADGKIYLCARKGTVTVVKAGKEFEILSKNEMEDSISASPAIAGGRIYLRTFNALYAIGK